MTRLVAPFTIPADETALADLRARLANIRWPAEETVAGWEQGVPLAYLKGVCEYWLRDYDWPTRAAALNELPQFTTLIDGVNIHFIHARSPEPAAIPLLLTHGWPGSFIDFSEVVHPLSDPAAHGANPNDAFHVVCPSLPGYGFSSAPTDPGWHHERIADAWFELMTRLGYERFAVQGGDWGSAIATEMAIRDQDARLLALHVTSVRGGPTEADRAAADAKEAAALADLADYVKWDSAYLRQQATRPQTLGYGLADSPVAQCAWILEKIHSWTDHDTDPVAKFGYNRILDNVMVYWLSNSGATSARLYWEGVDLVGSSTDTVATPTGVSIFAKDIYRPSRRWAARTYRNIVYWNELPAGGHFAQWEQPDLFIGELREYLRRFRSPAKA